jgi:hypothetical protein
VKFWFRVGWGVVVGIGASGFGCIFGAAMLTFRIISSGSHPCGCGAPPAVMVVPVALGAWGRLMRGGGFRIFYVEHRSLLPCRLGGGGGRRRRCVVLRYTSNRRAGRRRRGAGGRGDRSPVDVCGVVKGRSISMSCVGGLPVGVSAWAPDLVLLNERQHNTTPRRRRRERRRREDDGVTVSLTAVSHSSRPASRRDSIEWNGIDSRYSDVSFVTRPPPMHQQTQAVHGVVGGRCCWTQQQQHQQSVRLDAPCACLCARPDRDHSNHHQRHWQQQLQQSARFVSSAAASIRLEVGGLAGVVYYI